MGDAVVPVTLMYTPQSPSAGLSPPVGESAWRDNTVVRLSAAESADAILGALVELSVPELSAGCVVARRDAEGALLSHASGEVSSALRTLADWGGAGDPAPEGASLHWLREGEDTWAVLFVGDAPLARCRAEIVATAAVALAQARRRSGVTVDPSRGAAAQAFGELIAKASHELRTPLMSILGWTGLLQTGRLDEARREKALEAIDRNAREQARLVTSLLDMGRAIAGRLEVERQPVSLRAVVEQAVGALRVGARKGVELTARCDEVATVGDAERIRQGVEAMLTAAVKSLASGTVTVDLRAESGDAVIEVTARTASGDVPAIPTGPSLGLEIAARLFAAHDGSAGLLPSGAIRAQIPIRSPD